MPPSASSKLSRAQILRSLKSSFKKSQHKLQSKLADDIFYNVDTQDIRDVGGENLTKIVDSATKALAKKGSTISIDPAVGGRSLITVCMKNRPFIVDSTLAVLTEQGQDIELIAHPVVNLGDKTPTLAEKRSLVFIIMRTPDQSKLKTLKSKLKETLGQVRLLTDDWRKMLAVVDETINRYRTNPPPLPSDQLAEGIQFLEWLCDENFTFMGMRYYGWPDKSQSGDLIADHKTALGILKDANLNIMTRNGSPVVVTDEIRAFLNSETPLIITKANMKTNVHRRAYLDYVGIKQYDDIGNLIGELRLVGLFTSSAYTRSVMRIPYLRHKANGVLRNYRADPTSHSGKALVNILETWPRDELFQIEPEQLHAFAGVAVRLEERPRVRVLPRVDRFDRFVSVIVYVPRERYDSKARLDIGAYLAKAYQGRVSAWYPQFLENGLTRVHFIIGRDGGTTPVNSSDVLEAEINNITRNWDDAFSKLEPKSPPDFSAVYQERFDPEQALADTEIVNGLQNDTEIAVDFNLADGDPSSTTLKLFHLGSSIPLSRRVPLLENMGFHAIDELSYQIERTDGETVHLHEMRLRHKALPEPADESLKERLTECLLAIWNQRAENDRFNGLVLTAGFSWSEALIFRAYSQYLRQIGSQFTLRSMAQTLITLSTIAGQLSQLFDVRLTPATTKRDDKEQKLEAKIFGGLESVTSSDDDRIIRNFVEVLNATLRTNLYQPDFTPTKDVPAPILAFKFDPAAISIMPKPVPYREIFVSSPRVEGLHLRFGPVARGGLRWSDRALDYRTEVLGLVKAQQVKNAVIVPVGSKGGFLPKQLPKSGDRNAWFQEGHSSYKIFISSLLSVTDNLVDGKVVPPPQTVRHDGDDPYFVVAADKGTSTFSDTANAISQGRDFWLDDAFASGGSAGYDHKKMGITARGGWEAVKRH